MDSGHQGARLCVSHRRGRPVSGVFHLRTRLSLIAVSHRLAEHRFIVQATTDAVGWVVAITLAIFLRYDFAPNHVPWRYTLVLSLSAGCVSIAVGTLFGLYIGRYAVGSFEEVAPLVRTAILTTTIMFVINLAFGMPIGGSALISGGLFALLLMGSARYVYRKLIELHLRAPERESVHRLIVYGAGEGGRAALRSLARDPASVYLPVALVDDDPRKRHRRIMGVPVIGTGTQLAEAVDRHEADTLLIAIPSADGSLIGKLMRLGLDAGLKVKTVPPLAQLLGTDLDQLDIRDLTDQDLLGRRIVTTDIDAIAGYITGKKVLVTGAGGSIGSELCRQLYLFAPAELIMVDRDESGLHSVQMSIEGRALLDTDDLVLIDIRDRIGLSRLFDERRPDVVFHAAALKHLPMLERSPMEAVKTNIWGTLALLEAAAESGVERFVNISTDKAASPISVLGYSKRICERLTAYFAGETGKPFLSVRFGNVLGTRGSVLTAFQAQIAAGGPLTVTDSSVTRYFMTVEEAVQLVIQAGAIGRGGEALVLDMGEPVRIDDIARMLAAYSPHPIDIVYTGLRSGEKLHEVLLGDDEVDDRPVHPMISHVPVPPLAPNDVQQFNPLDPYDSTVSLMRSICKREATARPLP